MSFRKQKTLALRRTLQGAALDLFEQHGYGQVTVAQIAAAAGASESTVYRHFRTKEQLILWDEADADIERHFLRNLGKGTPFEVLQRAFSDAYSDLPAEGLQLLARRSRFIDSVPEVFAAMAVGLDADRVEMQKALASAHRRDPLEMELTVRFALSALVAGIDSWVASGAEGNLPDRIDAAFGAASKALG